ncbi:caffeic acid 3-O-methyltransferase 3-like [Cryptomeria japonica]|uniref:caffeic acid 3-O-methyltransferase 3-like n=1 Tax=Cryptomeria japonica TaxID=3369 RepID=UPI0027D9F1A4|nr:caffeic acid 3-O-methyltransferase 3-like [Cryptomeria japonica]
MEAHLHLYEMMLSAAKPMALKAVVLLNIPQIIATHGTQNPLSVDDIAQHISASTKDKIPHKEYLFRILRLLASCGVFTEDVDEQTKQRKYGLNNVSKLLVKEGYRDSCVPFLMLLADKAYVDPQHHFHDAVLEGCHPFIKVHGMNPWEYVGTNAEANKLFNEGMACHTKDVMASVVKMYDGFRSVRTVVDLAGGVGSGLSVIVSQHPHIQGINFDLPHVIATAPAISGVEHVGGNMFDKIPCGDIIFMKWILHDWDDEKCIEILKKLYEATPEYGKVLIVEALLDGSEGSINRLGLLFDIHMTIYTMGGKERSEEEFSQLFFKAGFKSYNIMKLPFLQVLIEVSKS